MTKQLMMVENFQCPLCGKPLASDEYTNAINQLREKEAQSKEIEIRELAAKHKAEIESLRKGKDAQIEALQHNLEESYNNQVSIVKRNYEKLNEEAHKQFEEFTAKMQEAKQKELEEKNRQIKELSEGQSEFRKLALEEANATAQRQIDTLHNEIKERDIQLLRFQQEVESLKKQVSQSQAELKGEAGELDLYASLTSAFPDDLIVRQKRGTSTGDLIQKVRTAAGELEIPIVYDNKEAATVAKQDVQKARKYKKIHKTDYVIIVSNSLPKKDVPNGLFGEKEGVLLVHPSIIVEVAKQIRNALIEISRQAKSKEDRDSKQGRLYDYIRSAEFRCLISELSRIRTEMFELQNKEERYHQTLWKERKGIVEHLVATSNEMESGIESIIQDETPSLVEDAEEQSSADESVERGSTDQ